MNPLLQPTDLNIAHVQAIVRGMYAVAQAEGVHHTELVMMRDFYEQCARDTDAIATFEDVLSTPFESEAASGVLNTDALRQTFIASCVFLGYADGTYSKGERDKVRELGAAIGIPSGQIDEIEDLVADQLMAQFAHIDNLEALQAVAGEIRSS